MLAKFPGLIVAIIIALIAQIIQQQFLAQWGISVLVVAIILGSFAGHFFNQKKREALEPGLSVARGQILRFAIILYGFNITFGQFTEVGFVGLSLAVLMICLVLSAGIYIGKRWFKLDTELAILISIGSAICGAAAVAAAEPILKSSPYKVAVAVATVVIFGTLSMFIYPLIAQWLILSDLQYGLWIGASIHEVAQVVVAGTAVSENAGHVAVVEKMIRVTMLVPVLLLLSVYQSMKTKRLNKQAALEGVVVSNPITVPWFALLFLVMVGFNSLALITQDWVAIIIRLDGFLLTIAMAALGIMTHVSVMKKAGAPALGLASVLFIILMLGGYILTSALWNL